MKKQAHLRQHGDRFPDDGGLAPKVSRSTDPGVGLLRSWLAMVPPPHDLVEISLEVLGFEVMIDPDQGPPHLIA